MTALALLATFIWIYLLCLHGGFWQVAVPRPVASISVSLIGAPSVAVVIPARNEAGDIAQTLISLFRQTYQGRVHIIVVDDHSTDGTGEIARQTGVTEDAADRLTVIAARDLPPGWTGKLWAVSEGMEAARGLAPDFILMTDADITHSPTNLAELMARAQSESLDLTSLMVRLRCVSLAEQALIPAFVFFFFMLYPPRLVLDPSDQTAAAAGGCMLIRAPALDRIGGIAAIRGALIDDCALAKAIKKSGGKIRLDVTHDTVSSRVYGTFSEVWSVIARTAFTQLRYSPAMLLGTLIGLFITYLAPPLFVWFGHGWIRLLGAIAWALMVIAFRPTLRLYGRSTAWGLALPLIATFYAAATLGSAVNYWRGRGGHWKGRAQAGHAT